MTIESSREVLRRLELRVTRKLDGLLQGDYRGLIPGHGSEPGETRLYQPGDDVRRIDWNVTARTQQTHIRESIADRELETWLCIDQSASLDFGTAAVEKRDLALQGAAAIGFLTARVGNRIGAVLVGPAGLRTVPARQGRTHLMAILHLVQNAPRAESTRDHDTDLSHGIRRLLSPSHRRGLAVIISDLLAPVGWADEVARLRMRHDVLVIEVIDPRELALPNVGILSVVDPETGRLREINTRSAKLRQRFAEAALTQRDNNARLIRRAGADHLILRTDSDWLLDIVRFVVLRRKRLEVKVPS